MIDLYPWQQTLYQKILDTFLQGRGHHALLFKTETGIGAETLLQQLAAWLLCQKPQANTICHQCQSCHLFLQHHHPDFYLLQPLETKTIGVEQVREINEKLYQHSHLSGNKVVWLQGLEKLSEAGANALLKTLEEPVSGCYFLLQADLAYPILPTIYSRCQSYTLSTPNPQTSMEWLQQQGLSQTPAQLDTALRINQFRPLTTLHFIQQNQLEKRLHFLRQFWLFTQKKNLNLLLPHFEMELILTQLDWIIAFLSDALKARLGINQGWICADLASGVVKLSQGYHQQKLLRAVEIVQQMRTDLVNINAVNQELILIDGLTKLLMEIFNE
ncbi:DNA polymerase III subunit delta' [Mergibacter septicus]|uniref:DNA polymerase III subunit delta' n=1 Tax=Mergibacter septicus TaxID=221402 RepID=UPI00117987C9|nr:DNA polymerase III subunit delta' [Mergibacter septicus]AWX14221.1 DNA polymerase III subunit delta' [Mergibacter septicus]